MTYEGAKATILLEYCGADSCGDCDNCVLGKAIEALGKQIPKKPVLEKTKGIVGIDMWHCPACDEEIISDWNRDIANPYCHLCGQRLDWSKPKGNSYDFAIIDEVIAYDTEKKD